MFGGYWNAAEVGNNWLGVKVGDLQPPDWTRLLHTVASSNEETAPFIDIVLIYLCQSVSQHLYCYTYLYRQSSSQPTFVLQFVLKFDLIMPLSQPKVDIAI